MPVIKMDLLMESGNSGWSETHYISDDNASVVSVLNEHALAVGQARANLLGKFAKVAYVRASDLAIERDSLVLQVNLTNQLYPGNTAELRADGPGFGWYVRVEAGSTGRRQLFTRGMPDGWFGRTTTGDVIPPPEMVSALAQYLAVCRTHGCKMQILDKSPISNPTIKVQSIVNNGGFVGLTFNEELGSTIFGKIIQTYGFRGFRPSFSGRFLVTGYTAADGESAIKLDRQYNFTALGTYRKGRIRLEKFVYGLLTDMVPIRPATRRVGRPSFQPVGRHRRASK